MVLFKLPLYIYNKKRPNFKNFKIKKFIFYFYILIKIKYKYILLIQLELFTIKTIYLYI